MCIFLACHFIPQDLQLRKIGDSVFLQQPAEQYLVLWKEGTSLPVPVSFLCVLWSKCMISQWGPMIKFWLKTINIVNSFFFIIIFEAPMALRTNNSKAGVLHLQVGFSFDNWCLLKGTLSTCGGYLHSKFSLIIYHRSWFYHHVIITCSAMFLFHLLHY